MCAPHTYIYRDSGGYKEKRIREFKDPRMHHEQILRQSSHSHLSFTHIPFFSSPLLPFLPLIHFFFYLCNQTCLNIATSPVSLGFNFTFSEDRIWVNAQIAAIYSKLWGYWCPRQLFTGSSVEIRNAMLILNLRVQCSQKRFPLQLIFLKMLLYGL